MKLADSKKHGFDWNSVLDFCRKNIRYISAGIIVVILVIVLAVTTVSQNSEDKGSKEENGTAQEQEKEELMEEFEVDAIPEINTLIQSYYTAYAAGDLETLETYATPISDIEKGYITLMSQYVNGYENIQCNTKAGLAEGEYAVSVVMDMRFENVETMAPGLDFFYVRTNEDGSYYIDNLYSQFNLQNRELELDSQVEAFIENYESQEDMQVLCIDVQSKYDEALAADETLKDTIENVIPQAIQTWVAEITGSGAEEQPTEEQPSEEQPTEEQPAEEQPTEEQPVDEQPAEENQAASETVYATKNVNIRKEPNESAEKAGSAVAGQSFTRTGITEDGWSEIEYDGAKAYIKSDYLSTQAPEQTGNDTSTGSTGYLTEGTTITANKAYNVRASMDEDAERVGTTDPGDKIKVVMSYEEGWTKVEWKDKTGYIKTDLLLNN